MEVIRSSLLQNIFQGHGSSLVIPCGAAPSPFPYFRYLKEAELGQRGLSPA